MDTMSVPQIGEKAPEFQAQSTRGNIRFPGDFKGKWVVLFSFPGAFHPVCSSELQALCMMQAKFSEKNCAIMSFSPDSKEAHAAWMAELAKNVPGGAATFAGIPLAADDGSVIARRYGVWRPGASRPMRGIFMVDPKGIVRAVSFYPLGVGRNMNEIFRLLLALQALDAEGVSIPANWNPTDGMLRPTALSHHEQATQLMDSAPVQAASETPQMPAPGMPADKQPVSAPPVPQGQVYEQGSLFQNATQLLEENAAHVQKPASSSNGAANIRREQPLRPVSQSVWDALAEAQPQVPSQPAAAGTIPVPPFVHTPSQPTVATSVAKKPEAAHGAKPHDIGVKNQVKAESVSIADQNRLLLGNLLDKEDAQNGSVPEGHDYLMMRDFPYKT